MRTHKKPSLLSMLLVCIAFVVPTVAVCAGNSPIMIPVGKSGIHTQEMAKGLTAIKTLIEFACEEVYPKPSDDECIDRAKHGIGESFDPHSEYMSIEEFKRSIEDDQGEFGGVGIEISKNKPTSPLVVVNVMEDTPSYRAGLLSGDIISYISEPGNESIPTASLKNVNDAVKLLRGVPGTTVNLKVVRKDVDKPMNFSIKREIIIVVQVKGELIKSGESTYAIIENKQFGDGNKAAMRAKYLDLVKRAGGKLSGLIIRLENNPGGFLDEVYNDVDLFLDAKSIVLERSNNSIDSYYPPKIPGARTPGDITNGLPILVVVNGGSASASEIFAGAMKHFGRAVIAGTSRTFGKGVVQRTHPISDGSAIKLTSSEYLIGSKTDWIPVQCVGITPDILFEYPGVKNNPRMTECEMSGHVNTAGPMLNGPIHFPIKEANPALYKAGEVMLKAYIAHMTPKLLAEEEKRKRLEAQ